MKQHSHKVSQQIMHLEHHVHINCQFVCILTSLLVYLQVKQHDSEEKDATGDPEQHRITKRARSTSPNYKALTP